MITNVLHATNMTNYAARMKSISIRELKIDGNEDLQLSTPNSPSPFGKLKIIQIKLAISERGTSIRLNSDFEEK